MLPSKQKSLPWPGVVLGPQVTTAGHIGNNIYWQKVLFSNLIKIKFIFSINKRNNYTTIVAKTQ